MTYKEAYGVISEMIHLNLLTPQESEALQIALNALENFLSRKPVVEQGNRATIFRCPQCRNLIAYRIDDSLNDYLLSSNVCVCGQEIDWGDEK